MGKKKNSVSIIGGADGPTSIFIAGKSKKFKLSDWIRRICYKKKRKKVEKKIINRKIITDPHTLEEVADYLRTLYHAREVSKHIDSYIEQRKFLRESLIIQYKPELLGKLAKVEKPKTYTKREIEAFWKKIEQRSKKAEEISEEVFPIDFHLYKIRIRKLGEIEIYMENTWNILSVSSCSGSSKKAMKQLKRILKSIYCYYGVSKEDVQNRSERYLSLVTALCS